MSSLHDFNILDICVQLSKWAYKQLSSFGQKNLKLILECNSFNEFLEPNLMEVSNKNKKPFRCSWDSKWREWTRRTDWKQYFFGPGCRKQKVFIQVPVYSLKCSKGFETTFRPRCKEIVCTDQHRLDHGLDWTNSQTSQKRNPLHLKMVKSYFFLR